MIEEFEARRRILRAVARCAEEEPVALGESLDRVTARDLAGRVDLPGFDNSSMDGYAVRAAEAGDGAVLALAGEQPAGTDRELELAPGTAIRIFTGAPLPRGADAVVMQEDVRVGDGRIRIVEGVVPGENIRPRGGDVCAGQRLVPAGSVITPAIVGLLASQGFVTVPVRPRPRVGIVTTGDELVEGGAVPPDGLAPGQLFNSNGPMLEALVRRQGGAPRRWHAPDEPEALGAILAEALDASDFLLVAGGVSVGDRDFVKETLAGLGVISEFWRVRIKPGKPFLFGRREGDGAAGGCHVFGLPGNPVSAFVTCQVFAAPAMAWWSGREGFEDGETLALMPFRASLGAAVTNPGDRPHYLRMVIDRRTGVLRPTGLQQSHALFGLSRADALLRMEGGDALAEGESVEAWYL